jgi:hypothetical protein
MQLPKCYLPTIISGLLLLASNKSNAQLLAFGEKSTDHNCKTIYLVNPSSDSIYYIGGVEQSNLKDCMSFFTEQDKRSEKYMINVSKSDGAYLLLLPKDTIAYKIIIPAEHDLQKKELLLLSRYCPTVISTNEDKKRIKQIKRLKGKWLHVAVTE